MWNDWPNHRIQGFVGVFMAQDKSYDIMSSCLLLPKQKILGKKHTYCCVSKCCANTSGVGLKY